MKHKEKFIKKSLRYREYTPPIIHLEFLSDEEFNIALQIVGAFEGACVAFATVTNNDKQESVLNVSTFGFMSELERQRIFKEVRSMPELSRYKIILD